MEFIRPKKTTMSLDIAPLIDVVFLLLIFFMLTSAFSHSIIRLDLPQAATQDAPEQEHISISLDTRGRAYLLGKEVEMEVLQSKLHQLLVESPQKAVHLRGDRAMPYQFFVEAMDRARRSGARRIHIVHEAEQS